MSAATHLREEEAEEGVVAALTHEGAGVVRGGKTVFVAGALPGETIRYRRVRRRRQYDEGELLEVLAPSATRVTPRCRHFGVCGGCALQHLSPDAQLAAKEAELREALVRIGELEPREWLAPLRGPAWQYRRRARLGARYVTKKGRVLVGFRERASSFVADLTACEILAPPVGELIEPLAALLTRLTIRDQAPQIEIAVGEGDTVLVLRVLEPPSVEDEVLLREFGTAHGVRWYLQPGGLESVQPLGGTEKADLTYRLPQFGVTLAFEPTDFIQVNGAVNRELVARAVELLAPDASSRVLDLFCGLGNFTLALARVAHEVVGVEGEATLVERARANARTNGIANARFLERDLAQPLSHGAGLGAEAFTHVLLDPPRAGAAEILASIAALHPRRVLYVSCHPGTLARDLGSLVREHGFVVAKAGVIDMFPHTTHVESLAVLEPAP